MTKIVNLTGKIQRSYDAGLQSAIVPSIFLLENNEDEISHRNAAKGRLVTV